MNKKYIKKFTDLIETVSKIEDKKQRQTGLNNIIERIFQDGIDNGCKKFYCWIKNVDITRQFLKNKKLL